MDLSAFREFAELALHKSYTTAAQSLNLSQPTLSRHIDALERELNSQLVADVLPVRLTPAGDAVLQTALRMSDLFSNLQDELADMHRTAPARIRIHDTLTLRPLLARLAIAANETARSYPHATIEYVMPRSGKAPHETIRDGLCDLSFAQVVENGSGSICENERSTNAIPLSGTSGRLVFGVPQESSLAECADIDLASLRHEAFFIPAHRSCEPFKNTFVEACRARGFRPVLKMIPCDRLEDFYLLDHGDGVHVLSESDFTANATLMNSLRARSAFVPLASDDDLHIRWHALRRPESDNPAFERFFALLTEPGNDSDEETAG